MSDQFDRASELEQLERESCLAKALGKVTMVYTGECHWCGDRVQTGCFCNAECRDDYEHDKRVREIGGM